MTVPTFDRPVGRDRTFTARPQTSGDRGFTPRPITRTAGQASTHEQRDALARLRDVLDSYGLGELADWAWQQILAGASQTQILQDLREQPLYKQTYGYINDARLKAGLPALSTSEIATYRRTAAQSMRAAGLPPGFFDSRDDFDRLLINDVSAVELNRRIDNARVAAYEWDPGTRAEFFRLYREHGMESEANGAWVATFLDPQKAEPLIKARMAAAETAAGARRAGFGHLDASEAERLAQAGVTGEEAEQRFGAITGARELFTPLDAGEDAIGRAEQIGVAAGDTQSRQKVERRARRRTAQFEGGGSYASGREGVSGLGSAES